MRVSAVWTAMTLAAASASPLLAQQGQPASPPQGQSAQPAALAPAKPYKPVQIKLPQPMKDASFDTMRGRLGEAAKKRDRVALGRLVVEKNFFWDRETGDVADKKKSGIDNLTTALGLAKADNPGWDMLAALADDPTASASRGHKGAFCAPADPDFDGKSFGALLDATQTDPIEWVYPLEPNFEVREKPLGGGAAMDKLGLHFVRVLPDDSPAAAVASYIRIVTPSGKTGYVAADSLAPIGNDQICYVKEGGAWKLGGYVGAGDAQ